MKINEISNIIFEYTIINNCSTKELCKSIGIPENDLRRIQSENSHIDINSIIKVAKYFGVYYED